MHTAGQPRPRTINRGTGGDRSQQCRNSRITQHESHRSRRHDRLPQASLVFLGFSRSLAAPPSPAATWSGDPAWLRHSFDLRLQVAPVARLDHIPLRRSRESRSRRPPPRPVKHIHRTGSIRGDGQLADVRQAGRASPVEGVAPSSTGTSWASSLRRRTPLGLSRRLQRCNASSTPILPTSPRTPGQLTRNKHSPCMSTT